METFWDFLWFMIIAFVWVAWIMLLFRVFADLFRSHVSGGAKAGWSLFVIFFPFLGVLVYLIAHGGDMAKRDVETAQAIDQAQRAYIQDAAGSSPADQLHKLADLKDRGVISDEEFATAKAKILT